MKKVLVACCFLIILIASVYAEQCKAITKKGTRCKRAASPSSEFCWQHGGTTKAERTARGMGITDSRMPIKRDIVLGDDSSSITGRWDNLKFGIPGKCDQVIDREGFAIGYNESWEQPAWVIYRLTKSEVMNRKASRLDGFKPDPVVASGSADLSDYAGSGYDRGHLAPAGDMHWSERAMAESFFMSNMSPQDPSFNRGAWARLERVVRRFAYAEESVYVVTGPIVASNDTKTIGPNGVRVPGGFYKIIYDETPPQKMIAFIMPNKGTNKSLDSYVVSVDEVERITGLDFFSALPQDVQSKLESKSNANDWSWRDARRGALSSGVGE